MLRNLGAVLQLHRDLAKPLDEVVTIATRSKYMKIKTPFGLMNTCVVP